MVWNKIIIILNKKNSRKAKKEVGSFGGGTGGCFCGRAIVNPGPNREFKIIGPGNASSFAQMPDDIIIGVDGQKVYYNKDLDVLLFR